MAPKDPCSHRGGARSGSLMSNFFTRAHLAKQSPSVSQSGRIDRGQSPLAGATGNLAWRQAMSLPQRDIWRDIHTAGFIRRAGHRWGATFGDQLSSRLQQQA
jgi:hypothetical protein